MISRMKWAAGRKLRANTGETLTEVLISVLVIALGMTMFLSAFLVSGRMLRQGEEQMESYYDSRNQLENNRTAKQASGRYVLELEASGTGGMKKSLASNAYQTGTQTNYRTGQERCECRRCRNRHCRQQKQTASKGHRKLFSVCQKKLRSQNGMTLTELLAAIVILGMIGTVLGGGVMMVKNVYQRTQEQADAEQALSLTAQLMTDEFANALEVKNSAGTSATGELVTPLLRSGNSHLWLHFSATDWSGTGIEKWYGDYTYDDAYNKISLLTQAAISDEYYTAFDGYTYSEETACFTVQNLAIYRKKDTMGTSRKAVVKPINLTVRAVNLDQK